MLELIRFKPFIIYMVFVATKLTHDDSQSL